MANAFSLLIVGKMVKIFGQFNAIGLSLIIENLLQKAPVLKRENT
jgi:hypothetical protein